MKTKGSDLHGNAPDNSTVALLLVDVINDFEFPGGAQLLRHALPAAPRIDPLDQLRLDTDVDVCGFALHAGEDGRCRAHPFDNCGQIIDNAQPLDSLRTSARLVSPGSCR